MRVLVTTTSGTGHIHPVVPLARALREAGHDVVWATAQGSCPLVEQLGFDTRPAGLSNEERAARMRSDHADAMRLGGPAKRVAVFRALFGEVAGPVMLDALGPLLDELQPDVVVHEMAELAAAPAATARGIRHVTVAFSGLLPEAVRATAAPSVARLWESAGVEPDPEFGFYSHAYLHPFPPSLGQRPDRPSVVDMRPGQAEAASSSEVPSSPESLGTRRPLVYMTYGTEMSALAPWPVLIGAALAVDADVVVTVGGGGDLDLLRETVAAAGGADRVHVERYVPQEVLLGRAAAVVSHGGAGTTLAALAHGVPQLLVPTGADQFENARAITGAGAGLAVAADEATVAGVADAVAHLLADTAFRDRAAHVADEIASMPAPDDLVDVVVHG